MHVEIQGMIFFQYRAEVFRHSGWQSSGNPRAYANYFQMRDGPQFTEDSVQFFIRNKKGVSARHDHITDFRIVADVFNALSQSFACDDSGKTDFTFSCTKPTDNRALIVDHQQYPVRIAVNQFRHRHVDFLIKRVGEQIFSFDKVVQLFDGGNHLFP